MRKRWVGLASLGIGAVLLSGGAASANDLGGSFASAPFAIARAAVDDATRALDQRDDQIVVAAGTLDDGKDLLAQAGIGIEDAVAAAQSAASGDIGEVDLEYFDGILVFNVDAGDKDVKVDASTGEVLSTASDD